MSVNLIAYIPTLNQRHLDWFAKHAGSDLFLITQKEAEKLLPRLTRNLTAVPTEVMARMLTSERYFRCVDIFQPEWSDFSSVTWKNWILPDEDVSHLFAGMYLLPAGCEAIYENIWARWDMKAVIAEQPVLPDVEISMNQFARDILKEAKDLAKGSPDWWRQVGAIVFDRDGKRLASAFNTHVPNEYETYIFGDPAINRDAGQKGKSCALHAEAAVIAECARNGLRTYDGKICVTTFPCESCAALIAAAEIHTIYFLDGYSSLNAQEIFRARGVKIIQVKDILV